MKLFFLFIGIILISSIVSAQDNITNQTNQTNQTGQGNDYLEQGKGILNGMYNNYKMMLHGFTQTTGIESEALSVILAIGLVFALLEQRARKYLLWALILFVILWILGVI